MNAMANEYGTILSQLSAELPDAEYGVATYDDYAYGSFGYSSSGDRPSFFGIRLVAILAPFNRP